VKGGLRSVHGTRKVKRVLEYLGLRLERDGKVFSLLFFSCRAIKVSWRIEVTHILIVCPICVVTVSLKLTATVEQAVEAGFVRKQKN
jgi:hypothetical protein